MKSFKKFLLVGLIFALSCSVSFAAPPEMIPLKKECKEKCFENASQDFSLQVSADQINLPVIITKHCLEDPGLIIPVKNRYVKEIIVPDAEITAPFYLLHKYGRNKTCNPLYSSGTFYKSLKKYQPGRLNKSFTNRRNIPPLE
jgi:hypothetical protein